MRGHGVDDVFTIGGALDRLPRGPLPRGCEHP
jgi:hypothetical protein